MTNRWAAERPDQDIHDYIEDHLDLWPDDGEPEEADNE